MSYYDEAISAQLTGRAPGHALLGFFDFVEGPRWLWNGSGILTIGGIKWYGLGAWASVTNFLSGAGDVASTVSFTLSGVDDEIIALAAAGATTIKGRTVEISEQFYHEETMARVGGLQWLYTGTMDRMTVDNEYQKRSVTVITEGAFTNRSKPPSGLLSDRDQQERFPGDLGLIYQPTVVQKVVKWPTY